MQAFLEKVIITIISKDIKHLEKCCFVVPNRRTGLYLRKYLSENLKKTIFSPIFLTIEEFAAEISGLEVADNLTLLSILYQSYKDGVSSEKGSSHPFDEFISWGNMLLGDFNDIDSGLADADKVFNYLSEAKAIAQWSPENPILTPFQKNYIAFYNSLSDIYTLFTERLLEKKLAYQGLMFKQIVDKNLYSAFLDSWEKIFFVGFNAFTPAEEKISSFFIDNKKAQLFFDYDHYYLNNKLIEAGFHIRKGIEKWGISPFHEDLTNYKNIKKNIHIIGIPQNIGQAKMCGVLLSKFETTDKPNDTAVILAKEELLFPVLNSLPDSIQYANVTMGFPLDKTLIFDLFDSIITLYDNAFRIQKLKIESPLKFNVKDILKISENSFLNLINSYENTQNPANRFNKRLVSENKLFYTGKQFRLLIKENFSVESPYTQILELICSVDTSESLKMIQLLNEVLNCIKFAEVFKHKNNLNIETEFLFYYSKMLKKLQVFFETTDCIEVNSFKVLHKMLIKTLNVPFTGEPLSGLQIMGLLESRNLDFKNVIMMSVNEGVLPISKSNNSFIPNDIRKHFDLQIYYENESIYAYHFYRLLQRAENIYLMYNTEHDILGSGEKSRFISQLLYELPKYNPSVEISNIIITTPLISDQIDYSISIEKNENVISLLNDKLKKGISPTSLSVYLHCKLRFYFQYILGLEVPEEPDETIDAAQLGSAVHDVLEQIYAPLVGKQLDKKDITAISGEVEDLLINAFKKNIQHIDVNFGKNHLLFKMAYKYIINFLKDENKLIDALAENNNKLVINSTEKKLETFFNLPVKDDFITVNLNGRVDRIDKTGDCVRIIDYKTGAIDSNDLNLNDWEMLAEETISGKIIQLLVYSYLYASNFKISDFVSGFISLKKSGNGLMAIKFPDGYETYNEFVHQEFDVFLKKVFSEMCDKEKPITQTKNEKNCQYCDFIKICNKI